ncbi:MAG: glycosyl transferase, partial [Allosphingosinicella sp.]
FSRRFAKSFPALARGFETETEISVHALELAMPVAEIVTAYGARPDGSASKLSTYRDGWRIMKTILHLFRIERPVLFYGSFSLFLCALAIVLVVPLAVTYLETGLVPRFPTAVLATGLMIVAALSFTCGLILDTVVRGRREVRRLHYLSFPAPGEEPPPSR